MSSASFVSCDVLFYLLLSKLLSRSTLLWWYKKKLTILNSWWVMFDVKYLPVVNLGQLTLLVLLHLDTLNSMTWWIPVTVDSDIDRLPTCADSAATTLPCRGPLSLLSKFVKSSSSNPDHALDLVMVLKFVLFRYYKLCLKFRLKYGVSYNFSLIFLFYFYF